MTIVALVSGCGNAYPGDGTWDGDGQGGRLGERIGVSRDSLITTF